jgi:Domain of unknown function (DUF4347)
MSRCVFIDARIGDIDSIIAGLASDVLAVILDSMHDGLDQIASELTGRTGVDAVHIISHGTDGTLYLGETVLTKENLARYSSQLAAIRAALSTEGDTLLYGCDVTATCYGQQFIEALVHHTGADVAASDVTGSAALGGNWKQQSDASKPAPCWLPAALERGTNFWRCKRCQALQRVPPIPSNRTRVPRTLSSPDWLGNLERPVHVDLQDVVSLGTEVNMSGF